MIWVQLAHLLLPPGKVEIINAREVAPELAFANMFNSSKQSKEGEGQAQGVGWEGVAHFCPGPGTALVVTGVHHNERSRPSSWKTKGRSFCSFCPLEGPPCARTQRE